MYYEPDARYVIQWFLRPHIHDELCLKRNDDAQLRTLEYLTVRNEIDALDAQMIGSIHEGDLYEQSVNGGNDTFDLEGAVTIGIKTARISPLIRIQIHSHVLRPQATPAGKRKAAILGFGDLPDLLRDFGSQTGSEASKRCRHARIEGVHSVGRPRA